MKKRKEPSSSSSGNSEAQRSTINHVGSKKGEGSEDGYGSVRERAGDDTIANCTGTGSEERSQGEENKLRYSCLDAKLAVVSIDLLLMHLFRHHTKGANAQVKGEKCKLRSTRVDENPVNRTKC